MELTSEVSNITLALQAYLDRSPCDLETMVARDIRVRLVKGAYVGNTSDYQDIRERLKTLIDHRHLPRKGVLHWNA
jgi:hypothetical protein